MPPDRANPWVSDHGVEGCTREIWVEHRVAVKKENELFGGATPSRIPATCRGRPFRMYNDDLRAELGSKLRTAVRRRGVHVDQLSFFKATNRADRLKTSLQALTLVPTDHTNGKGCFQGSGSPPP